MLLRMLQLVLRERGELAVCSTTTYVALILIRRTNCFLVLVCPQIVKIEFAASLVSTLLLPHTALSTLLRKRVYHQENDSQHARSKPRILHSFLIQENSTPFPPPLAASILLARSALLLLRLLSKLLRSVPVPASVPPPAGPGLPTIPVLPPESICEECAGGTGPGGEGRFNSESRRIPELDIAGGGTGTLVMGCWLEFRTCPPPAPVPRRRYLPPPSGSFSTPELKLELRREGFFFSPRFRDARSAAASSSLRRRRVTCRPSGCMLTLTLTGGLPCGTAPELVAICEAETEAVLARRAWLAPYLVRESCRAP